MAKGPRTRVPFRRRRVGKTDYHARIKLLQGRKPRAVVRRTLREIRVQFIDYDPSGDRVLAQAGSHELKAFGWDLGLTNTPAAYLTGLLGAKRAQEAGVETAVLDIGLARPTKGARVMALAQGIADGGLDIPIGDGATPAEERLRGEHIQAVATFEKVKAKLGGGT